MSLTRAKGGETQPAVSLNVSVEQTGGVEARALFVLHGGGARLG